jgi:ABC-type transport system involved in multi-copper enzyme maturation permease subunit
MKFLIKILYFLLIIFILNIIFYYISDDYKSFLKDIKYDDSDENIQTNIVENIDVVEDINENKFNNNSTSSNIDLNLDNEFSKISFKNDIVIQETIL